MAKTICAKLQEKFEEATKIWKSSSEEAAESILSMILGNNWQEGHKLSPQRACGISWGQPSHGREALVILDTMREHAALLEHLRSRNSHGARLAMEEHVVATAARARVCISSW